MRRKIATTRPIPRIETRISCSSTFAMMRKWPTRDRFVPRRLGQRARNAKGREPRRSDGLPKRAVALYRRSARRSRTRIIWTAVHALPVAVLMPRSLSALAAARCDRPASSANTGRSASARSSASA